MAEKIKTNIFKFAQKKPEEVLHGNAYISMEKLTAAITESSDQGKFLEQTLLDGELIKEDKLALAVCTELQLPYLDLANYNVSTDLIQEYKSLMVKYRFVPLDKLGDVLTILIGHCLDREIVEAMQDEIPENIFVYFGFFSTIQSAIDQYIPKEEQEAVHTEIIPESAQVTAGWESIFDVADEAVQQELRERADYLDTSQDGDYEEFLGLDTDLAKSGEIPNNAEQTQYFDDYQGKMEQLALYLEQNPFDYEAMNQYVELAVSMDDMESAIGQLVRFAEGLEQAGDKEGAANCYQYILELDPENSYAQQHLQKQQDSPNPA